MKKIIAICTIAVFALTGCSESTKQALGVSKKRQPDEFKVVKRAPLEIPDYVRDMSALPPPELGKQRPQEATPTQNVKEVVFGSRDVETTSTTNETFLNALGADNAQPNIRTMLEKENEETIFNLTPTIDKLISGGDPKSRNSVVDAPAELERIKKTYEEGTPINTGNVPSEIQ